MAKKKTKKKAKKKVPKKKVPKKKWTKKKVPKKKGTKKKSKKKVKDKEKTCFVMVPFKSPFDVYYTSIYKPAIKDSKLEPVRADDLFRPSAIVSDLWRMIQDAEVILAELTTKNANVFYELGLSHAVGKPVILVSETMDDVPFDLQQLRVLLYDKDDPNWGAKLKADITSSINETLVSPVEAVPSIFRKKLKSQAPEQEATIARIQDLEEQMRSLRLRNRRSSHSRTGLEPASELMDVHSSDELDSWFRRWVKRDLGPKYLLRLVEKSERIPPYEIDRLQEAFDL